MRNRRKLRMRMVVATATAAITVALATGQNEHLEKDEIVPPQPGLVVAGALVKEEIKDDYLSLANNSLDKAQEEAKSKGYKVPKPEKKKTKPKRKSKKNKPSKKDEGTKTFTESVGEGWKSLGTFMCTTYCGCSECSEGYGNMTSTGVVAQEGRTIAVDPSVIPYGTHVLIDGNEYIAEDCGGAVKGEHIDIYYESHERSLEVGTRYLEVKIKE